MSRLRTVIEEPYFALQLKRLRSDARLIDAFIDGAKWVLARDPEMGIQVFESIWLLPSNVPNGLPLNLYYSFDLNTVTLISIEVAES